jgi:VanZ family protein
MGPAVVFLADLCRLPDEMSLFVSPRERKMWFSAVGLLVLIYTTLGQARQVVDWLRERNTLRLAVGLVLVAVVVLLVRDFMRRRPSRRELLIVVLLVAAYASVLLWMDRAEERLHLVQYGLVAAFFYRALGERHRAGRRLWFSPSVGAVLLTTAAGWLDEGIQHFLPSRVYDLRDVAFNALAGLLAVIAMSTLGWAEGSREGGDPLAEDAPEAGAG